MKKLILSLSFISMFLFSCKKSKNIEISKIVHDTTFVNDTVFISGYSYPVTFPKLGSGWTTTNCGATPSYYMKDSIVYISGLCIPQSNASKIIFILDEKCRPTQIIYTMLSVMNQDEMLVSIDKNGVIYIPFSIPNGNMVILDNLEFHL